MGRVVYERIVVVLNYFSRRDYERSKSRKGRTAKVGAKVLVRRVVVIVLVLVLVLGVVRGGRRPVRQAGGVTRPSHSAAEIRICNTQQPLPTSHPFSIFINLTVRSCARCLLVLLSVFLFFFTLFHHFVAQLRCNN